MTERELFESWFRNNVVSEERRALINDERGVEKIRAIEVVQRHAWRGCSEFKNQVIAEKDAEIASLRAELEELRISSSERITALLRVQSNVRQTLRNYADPKFSDKGERAKRALGQLDPEE